jgi:internalin A
MSDLARALIAENKNTKATFLDLGNCGLREIPAEIGELVWLEFVSLGSEWWEWTGRDWQKRESQNRGSPNERLENLAPLASLTALQTLRALGTLIADLTPLAGLTALQTLDVSGTQVADFTPLAGLTALHTLDASGTQVADLTPLAGLTALHTLYVSRTQVADLTPLADLTALHTLYVSRTQVADLMPLAGLTAVHTLDVSDTRVADLTPLAGLTALQTLDVSATRVADLTPLAGLTALQTLDVSGTQIAELTPLADLTALQKLRALGTQIADLTPLAGLTALQRLYVSVTQIADLTPLAGLTALQTLDVSRTQVADLTPLAGLTALQKLRAMGTQIAELTPLAGLSALQILDISGTQVANLKPLLALITRGLPVYWSEGKISSGVNVIDCPLVSPPANIVRLGNEEILNYFRELDTGEVDRLYEAKLLILGEGGAGKTTLLRRLYQPGLAMPTEQDTTKGIDIHRHEFPLKNGRRFRLNVWDFGGQEIYHATHQFFLTHRSLYLLLDDTRKDHKSVSDEGFKYWLDMIDLFGGHSPVLIFQNEKGGRSKAIDIAGIKGQYDNVLQLFAGNLEHKNAADTLREAIEYFASNLKHIGEELPARWLRVRASIEARAADTPYITQKEFFDIYAREIESDSTRALHLSRYLHDLGVFLHFQDDPLLRRTVILQNQWATTAVFRLLDDESIKARWGRFTADDCERLWRDSLYADMHPELLALMQRFELCYQLADGQRPTWLAPQLLPPAKPVSLTNWSKSDGSDLVLRYRYDFLPKGTISRLTVRLHRIVNDPEMAWVTGVLFQRDASSVLVEVLPKPGNEIELRARGTDRKALLSVVAAELDALNETFRVLRDKVDQLIPCICPTCRTAPIPYFFPQKVLLRRKEDKRLRVECPVSYADVDVLELLDGIRLETLPGWAHEPSPTIAPPRTIRIFLASSQELREDRDAFDLYFRQQNDRLRDDGLYLEIVRWENFLDAMSNTRLQDEYNEAVRSCDVFVSLFFTKTGRFTEEEFNVAHAAFTERGKPRIYTFFKNANVRMGEIGDEVLTLLGFKKKLADHGHFHTTYNDIEHLKRQFRDQIDELLESGV